MSTVSYQNLDTMNWKAPVTNVAALPSVGNTAGDARVTLDTDSIYIWSGSAWVAAGGSSGGVTTINTLTGDITLAAGSNITITPSGNTLTIASTAGGVSIGDHVSGSGSEFILYTDGSGNLIQDFTNNFAYHTASSRLQVINIDAQSISLGLHGATNHVVSGGSSSVILDSTNNDTSGTYGVTVLVNSGSDLPAFNFSATGASTGNITQTFKVKGFNQTGSTVASSLVISAADGVASGNINGGNLILTSGAAGSGGVQGSIQLKGTEATGAGVAALSTNSPAITNTAPYTWFKLLSFDGSIVYVPAWK